MAQTASYSTSTGLSISPEFDQKKYPEIWADLVRIRNGIRSLQAALDTYTGQSIITPTDYESISQSQSLLLQSQAKVYVPTSVAVSPGQFINLYDSTGALTARLADATAPHYAHGFASISVAAAPGDYISVTLFGADFYVAGLTLGATYYLSNTPGAAGAAPGTNTQALGYALDTTNLWFAPAII